MNIKELYLKALNEEKFNKIEVNFIRGNLESFLTEQSFNYINELDILEFDDYYLIDINCGIINSMEQGEIDNIGIEILI